MLPINILSIGNIFLNEITCLKKGIIKNEIEDIIEEHREISDDLINEYYCVEFGPKGILCNYASNSIKQDVNLVSFRVTKPDKVNTWKKRFEGATWIVSFSISDTPIYNKSYNLMVVWSVDNLKCYFYMGKNDLLDICVDMCKLMNNEVIKFSVKTSEKTTFPIYTIKCINKRNIILHRPLLPDNEYSFIKKFIDEDMRNYYESYTNYLFYLFRKIREKKEMKELDIYKLPNDVIILNFTKGKVPLLLFAPKYIPDLKFFGDFSIKLSYVPQEIPYGEENPNSFKNINPTICLQVERLVKETLDNSLNIQINLYKRHIKNQDNPSNMYRKPSHVYLNFSSGTIVSFKKQLIDAFIKLEDGKTGGYDFTLYFLKSSYTTNFHMKRRLLNSIKIIELETFGETIGAVKNLEICNFKGKNGLRRVKLKFHIAKDTSEEPNITNNIIYDILENKSGYFSIQVQTIDKILIEYKVNLTPELMSVLSSNRLKKYIKTIKKQKDSISEFVSEKKRRFIRKTQRFMKSKRHESRG